MKNELNIAAELKALREVVATKDELRAFREVVATKDELRAFREVVATKDELRAFREVVASKDELRAFREVVATKEDLKPLALAISKTAFNLKVLRETSTTKTDLNRVMDQIDHLSRKVDGFNREQLGHKHRLKVIEPKVDDHEERLLLLEDRD